MYEGRKKYDPEIHDEYLIHDTTVPLPHHYTHVLTIA